MKVAEFAACPPRMFLFLAELSQENPKLRRIWLRNYERRINGGVRH